jgi:hypothetical protein
LQSSFSISTPRPNVSWGACKLFTTATEETAQTIKMHADVADSTQSS